MTEFQVAGTFPCKPSTDSIVRYFRKELKEKMRTWTARMADNPANLGEIEIETLQFVRIIAGLLVAAVLNSEAVKKAVKRESHRVRSESPKPLKNGYRRPRRVRLLCGLVLLVATLYCAPRRPSGKRGATRGVGRRGKEGAGMYPEWSVLGISEGASPTLQEETARLSALMPSFEVARDELARRGVDMDVKTARRLTLELGGQVLSSRRAELEKWRCGELPEGDYLAGKKVAVAIDGGRARTRKVRKKGRKTKKNRNKYDTPWREPKLMTLYVVGPCGRMDKEDIHLIDGTLKGPDHLMELVAFHLYRLGASTSKRVVFLGDGADWIWNRVPLVAKRARLESGKWFASVDPSHVMSHISDALKSVKSWDEVRRKKERTHLKRLLLSSRLDKVLEFLEGLCGDRSKGAIVDAMNYLKKRRRLMNYARLRHLGMPIGSGSVESAIRRVVNLRVKSPGMFWDEENVERMVYLRGQILSGRLDEMMSEVKRHRRLTRDLSSDWEATPYSLLDAENAELELKPLLTEI